MCIRDRAYVPTRQVAASSNIDHFQLIETIVTDCLKKVDEEGLESVTFPAFGFGQGGYEVSEVAEPILKAIQEFSLTNPASLKTIRIAILDKDHYKQFNDHFCKFFDCDLSLSSPTSPSVFQSLKGKPVSYTHLRAHETLRYLVCRLLLEKKK